MLADFSITHLRGAQALALSGGDLDRGRGIGAHAADALAVNQSDGTAVFTGNVVIGQGAMRLSAGRVDVTYAEGGTTRIRSLRAEGDVTLVSGDDAAEAQEALYDVEAGQVTLIGDVILAQGGNVLTGQRMEVDLATGAARVEGRVRTILQPGQQGGGN